MAYNNELYHYGVKGMKWGIRRYRNKDGTLTSEGKIREQRKRDYKNRRSMSDADLDKKINRLKKEKQFKSLSEEDIAPGRTAVKRFMKSTGGKVLSSAAVGGLAYAGKHYISKRGNKDLKINWQELANFVFPNPHKKK